MGKGASFQSKKHGMIHDAYHGMSGRDADGATLIIDGFLCKGRLLLGTHDRTGFNFKILYVVYVTSSLFTAKW